MLGRLPQARSAERGETEPNVSLPSPTTRAVSSSLSPPSHHEQHPNPAMQRLKDAVREKKIAVLEATANAWIVEVVPRIRGHYSSSTSHG